MRQLTGPDTAWPESWKSVFNADAAEFWGWDVNRGYTYAYQRRFRKSIDLVESHLNAPATIVDIAAGQGNFTLKLAELGYTVCWNDIRDDLIGYVQLKYERGAVEYVAGNGFEALDGRQFDAVMANEVIEHVAHPDEFLKKLAMLCRPGGLIFLSTPNGSYFHSGLPTFTEIDDPTRLERIQFQPGSEGHLFLLTNEELTELASGAGLSVVGLSNFTSPVLAGDLKIGKVLRFLPRGFVNFVNACFERLPPRLARRVLMHTCVVLRRE